MSVHCRGDHLLFPQTAPLVETPRECQDGARKSNWRRDLKHLAGCFRSLGGRLHASLLAIEPVETGFFSRPICANVTISPNPLPRPLAPLYIRLWLELIAFRLSGTSWPARQIRTDESKMESMLGWHSLFIPPEILPSELYLNSRCPTVWSACSSTLIPLSSIHIQNSA